MTTTTTDYDHTTDMMRVGMVLPNGETVIAFRTVRTYALCADGFYNYFMYHIVSVRGGNNYHDYCDRLVSAMPKGWVTGGGEYHHDIYSALARIDEANN